MGRQPLKSRGLRRRPEVRRLLPRGGAHFVVVVVVVVDVAVGPNRERRRRRPQALSENVDAMQHSTCALTEKSPTQKMLPHSESPAGDG